jgi:hypothetical protein
MLTNRRSNVDIVTVEYEFGKKPRRFSGANSEKNVYAAEIPLLQHPAIIT